VVAGNAGFEQTRSSELRKEVKVSLARAVDQRVLEQVQGEHRGFLLVAPIRGEVATIHKKNKIIGTIPVLYDLEVAMLAVLAFVILAIAIALYLRRRGVVDRTDPSYVEGDTPASLVDVVVSFAIIAVVMYLLTR
jgi:hypothetical protein